jgi:hypothetical protein
MSSKGGDRHLDSSPSSISDVGARTLRGFSSTNKNESFDLSENNRALRMVNKEVDNNEDNDDDGEVSADVDSGSEYESDLNLINVDNSSEHDDVWSPNGNTSAGVIRLSLLALSAAIHAIEDIDSEGLTALMSCPVMEHHLESTVNARFCIDNSRFLLESCKSVVL